MEIARKVQTLLKPSQRPLRHSALYIRIILQGKIIIDAPSPDNDINYVPYL